MLWYDLKMIQLSFTFNCNSANISVNFDMHVTMWYIEIIIQYPKLF